MFDVASSGEEPDHVCYKGRATIAVDLWIGGLVKE